MRKTRGHQPSHAACITNTFAFLDSILAFLFVGFVVVVVLVVISVPLA